ncbi:MAG: NAD(P)/FAD-dependent oxidoreductase [Candidatus Hodarchaeota archaeon]
MPLKATYDVCIIGAGPAGCLAAKELASRGHKVALFEQFSGAGFPNHCSGLISEGGFQKLATPLPLDLIENKVSGARIYAPNGKYIEIWRKRKEMLVVDRAELDKLLANRATDEGASIFYSHKVTKLLSNKAQISGCGGKAKNGHWETNALVTICAEGVHARTLRQHGYPAPNNEWNLPAVQYEIENVDIDHGLVEIYHGSSWAPGFFAWIIPTRDNCARVGLATWNKLRFPSRYLLDKFIERHPVAAERLQGNKIVSVRGGIVPAAGPSPRTVFDGLVVVGDAAGQAKATTGGGVNIGGHCARIAGAVISNALEANHWKLKDLKKYEEIWRHHYQKELLLMSIFRRSIARAPNALLNDAIYALKRSGIEKMLREVKDIDLHATALTSWLLQPTFFKQAIRGLPFLILGIYSALVNV